MKSNEGIAIKSFVDSTQIIIRSNKKIVEACVGVWKVKRFEKPVSFIFYENKNGVKISVFA